MTHESMLSPSNVRTVYFNIMEGSLQIIVHQIMLVKYWVSWLFLNCDSLHARLKSHYNAEIYKKKKNKKIEGM